MGEGQPRVGATADAAVGAAPSDQREPQAATDAGTFATTELATSEDVFLGGRLRLMQPLSGYRAGTDAVLLAAAISAEAHHHVLDVGSGVGAVGLCLAARIQGVRVTLVEREVSLVALAAANIRTNDLSARVSVVEADIVASLPTETVARLPNESFDVVVSNPPFYDSAAGTSSKDPLRAAAHAMPSDLLDRWVRFMARMARPGGTLAMIHRTEALPQLFDCCAGRFGGLRITPIHARRDDPAHRVLVVGTKGSRAPLQFLPALIMHGDGQGFRPEIDAVLRAGAALPMPRRQSS